MSLGVWVYLFLPHWWSQQFLVQENVNIQGLGLAPLLMAEVPIIIKMLAVIIGMSAVELWLCSRWGVDAEYSCALVPPFVSF